MDDRNSILREMLVDKRAHPEAYDLPNTRSRKALLIFLEHDVDLDVRARSGQYLVRSQTDHSTQYTVKPHADKGACTCRDYERAHYVSRGQLRHRKDCKHVRAALMAEQAAAAACKYAQKRGWSLSHLESELLVATMSPHPREVSDGLLALLIGAQMALAMEQNAADWAARSQPKPHAARVELIVRVENSGARRLPHSYGSELVEVIEDGVSRKPQNADANVAVMWLQTNGYDGEPARWLEPPAALRKQSIVFVRKGAEEAVA